MKRIIQLVITLIGAAVGIAILNMVNAASSFIDPSGIIFIIANIIAGLIGGVIFYLISTSFLRLFLFLENLP